MDYEFGGTDILGSGHFPRTTDRTIGLSIAMLQAGATAVREWDKDKEEPELLAVEVFYRMLEKSDYQA